MVSHFFKLTLEIRFGDWATEKQSKWALGGSHKIGNREVWPWGKRKEARAWRKCTDLNNLSCIHNSTAESPEWATDPAAEVEGGEDGSACRVSSWQEGSTFTCLCCRALTGKYPVSGLAVKTSCATREHQWASFHTNLNLLFQPKIRMYSNFEMTRRGDTRTYADKKGLFSGVSLWAGWVLLLTWFFLLPNHFYLAPA